MGTDRNLDPRMLVQKGAEHTRQHILSDRERCANRELAPEFPSQRRQCFLGLCGQRVQSLDVSEQTRSGLGQSDVAAAAIEQSKADLFFQRFDLQGHRGLGEIQLFSRPAETQVFGHRSENPQSKTEHLRFVCKGSSPPWAALWRFHGKAGKRLTAPHVPNRPKIRSCWYFLICQPSLILLTGTEAP